MRPEKNLARGIDIIGGDSGNGYDLDKLLERVYVKEVGVDGVVDAIVPVGMIYREDVPVDDKHVREIAGSLQTEAAQRGGTGQLSPVLLAHVPDFGEFLIIDGFHRVATFADNNHNNPNSNGEYGLMARIRPNTSLDEVTDLRILTANTHKAVKFSRVVEWVEESWQRSPWADKISAVQAFTLVTIKSMTGERIGLDTSEVEEIKSWVGRKCIQWRLSAFSVYQYLNVAKVADPALVREVRERTSGRELRNLTPQHLSVIAKAFPHRYDHQQLAARLTKDGSLTVPKTRALVTAISGVEDIDEATTIAESGVWSNLEPVYSPSRAREIRANQKAVEGEVVVFGDRELLERFVEAEIEIGRLSIENAILSGRYSLKSRAEHVLTEAQSTEDSINRDDLGLQELISVETSSEIKSVWTEVQIDEFMSEVQTMEDEVAAILASKRFVFNVQDVEDILQNTSIRIYNAVKTGGLSQKHIPSALQRKRLLIKTINWEAIDLLRSRHGRSGQRIIETSIDEVDLRLDGDQPSKSVRLALSDEEKGYADVEDELSGEYLDYVKKMLPKFKDNIRRAFVLRAFFELPESAIGLIMGVTESRVSQILTVAKHILQDNAPENLRRPEADFFSLTVVA